MTDPDKIWPVTIILTRYGGTYEGGKWAAFNLDHEYIPDAVMGSDTECYDWWNHLGGGVGVGPTPDKAFENLVSLERRLQWTDIRDLARADG